MKRSNKIALISFVMLMPFYPFAQYMDYRRDVDYWRRMQAQGIEPKVSNIWWRILG